jgi:peptidoglycan/LPS O-acetylase OafA/YrhL
LKSPSAAQTYMPQLDSLRFFAVLGVMVSHFWIPRGLPWLFADMDLGWLGVKLFFVLSGFLITGILLDGKQATETTRLTPDYFIRQFYIRRFLRIFPIYYLVIAIALIVNIEPSRELWGWLVSYTSNIYITVHNIWIGYFSHFWSLAVEEQFYLIWPCLIMFLPRKWVPYFILLAICIAPIYRFWAYQTYRIEISPFNFKAATFTLASLDSLGMGAMLAYFWRTTLTMATIQKRLTLLILPLGVFLYIATLVLYHYHIKPSVFFTLNDFSASLIFTWLVGTAGQGFKGIAARFMTIPSFIYLGKISYGIYVYHYFMPLLITPFFNAINLPYQEPGFINFVISSLLTLVIASLSWRLIELPLNNFKNRFQYYKILQKNAAHTA